MTMFAWVGQLPLTDVPRWMVFLLALAIVWPGIVGCIHRCLQHFLLRTALQASGYVRVHTEFHRFGASSHTVEVGTRPAELNRAPSEPPSAPTDPALPGSEVRSA